MIHNRPGMCRNSQAPSPLNTETSSLWTASSSGESRANLPPRGFGPLHHLHTRGFRALSVRSQTTAHLPQPYAVYVDDADGVWVSDWGANAGDPQPAVAVAPDA